MSRLTSPPIKLAVTLAVSKYLPNGIEIEEPPPVIPGQAVAKPVLPTTW